MRRAPSLLLAAALIAPPAARAATIDVGPADTWAKIEGARPGDEVVIAPGTYAFRVHLTQRATADQPIVIRARDPSNPPVWDLAGTLVEDAPGSYTAGDRGRGCWQISGGTHYHISGIVFTHCRTASHNSAGLRYYNGAAGIVLRDCVFRANDNGLTGGSQDSEVTVEHSEFDGNGNLQASSSAPTHNLYVYGGTFTLRYSYVHDPVQGQNFHIRARTGVIEYSWIARGRSYEGDLMTDDDFSSGSPPFGQSLLLRGNVIVQDAAPQNGSQVVAVFNDAGLSGLSLAVRLVNNTFVGNGGHAALVHLSNADGTLMSAELSNNVVYGTTVPTRVETSAAASVNGASNWLASGVDPGPLASSVRSAAPGFTSLAAKDFTPDAGSALVDAASQAVSGLPDREYYRDETRGRLYRLRASARDIGAFESTTAGPAIGPYGPAAGPPGSQAPGGCAHGGEPGPWSAALLALALRRSRRGAWIAALASACLLAGCQDSAGATGPSIAKDGITWTFRQPVQAGQFVNGDWWVVGPVTVTAVSPAPTASLPFLNGSVRNLPTASGKSGFDSRLDDGVDQSWWFDPTARAYPPISLQPGDSLVSSISVAVPHSSPAPMRSGDTSISPVASMSVLTVLAQPPAADAFRPSYCDRAQRIYRAAALDRTRLPSLHLASAAGIPPLAELESLFRRPWVDLNPFNFDAPAEYMAQYGREVAMAVSYASLLLALDFAPEVKVPLTNYLVQYGIDLHGCLRAGHGWPAFGGHASGRKLPIVLAGLLLGEPAMQQVSDAFPDRFGEDMQTMYVSQTPPAGTYATAWQGATAVYAGHYGLQGNGQPVEVGINGPYEHLQPGAWPGRRGEDYRRCCTSVSWVGEALALRLLQAEPLWNHPAFFDYVDRWMFEDDAQAVADILAQTGIDYGAGWARQRQTMRFLQGEVSHPTFIDDMWAAFRPVR